MAEKKLQVPVVVGTRPEAIKLVSLILALRASENYEPIVVSTGQHNRLVEYIFELADIKPDVTLWAGSRRAALNERVASVMQRFEDFCVERFDVDPDVIPTREDVLAGNHPAMVLVPTRWSPVGGRRRRWSTATPARRWRRRSPPSTCGSR
jgi:UDP-N-acetylglucosamine 2-epimerase (non-hydrolysing)